MLASDVNNTQFSGAQDPDSVMIAKFYIRAVPNQFKSKEQGRQIFEDILFVEYYPAGSTLLKMDVPALEMHKQRFHKQWAYYQLTNGGDSREVGTPLSQWPILSPADVENLRAQKFNTIENIASASDSQLQSMGMGAAGCSPHSLRARAQAYLTSAQDSAFPQKQAEEMEAMKKQIADLTAMLTAKPADAPVEKKKGRREWTHEQKAAASERMKKAREAKQHKAA